MAQILRFQLSLDLRARELTDAIRFDDKIVQKIIIFLNPLNLATKVITLIPGM